MQILPIEMVDGLLPILKKIRYKGYGNFDRFVPHTYDIYCTDNIRCIVYALMVE